MQGKKQGCFYKDMQSVFRGKEQYTFLVGAGISMDPPSCIPSARELVKNLIEAYTSPNAVEAILALPALRYEMLVEQIEMHVDKEFSYLDYFDIIEAPNINHLFLANAIIKGYDVVTTNFDYMIERALMQVVPGKKHSNILPVITRDDFVKYNDPSSLHKHDTYPIYKIHGSKKNIITGAKTIESLVTTISALGKNRAKGVTFALEDFKQPAFENLVKGRSLVVMGYSGRDDFDIAPALRAEMGVNRIIWIDHVSSDSMEIYSFNKDQDQDSSPLVDIDDALSLIYTDSMCGDVIKIKGNTASIVAGMWPALLGKTPIPAIDMARKPISYTSWFNANIKKIDAAKQLLVGNEVLIIGNDFEHATQFAEMAIQSSDLDEKAQGFLYLGWLALNNRNNDPAREYFEKALELFEQQNNLIYASRTLTLLGQAYMALGDIDRAIEIEERAMKLGQEVGHSDTEASANSTMSRINELRGNHEEAIRYISRSIEINEEHGNLRLKCIELCDLGLIYFRINECDQAVKYLEESYQIAEKIGDDGQACADAGLIAEALFNMDLLSNIDDWIDKAIKLAKKMNDKQSLLRMYYLMGLLAKKKGALDAAINLNNDVIVQATELGLYDSVMVAEVQLGHIYWGKQDYPNALLHYQNALDSAQKLGREQDVKNIQGFINNTPPKNLQ